MNSHSQDHRTNEDWVRELRGDLGAEKQAEAYLDLGCLLDRVVRPYLRKIAGSYQQDDLVFSIVQDTLRKIYQKKLYDSYAGKAKFTSYICAIATHQAISEMRKKQWKMERTLESLPEEQSDAKEEIRTLAPKYLIDLTSLDPETQLELNDFAQDIRACIEGLKQQRKLVLLWRIEEELDSAEIANRLNKSINAVTLLFLQARKDLKACLLDKGWTAADIYRLYTAL